MTRGISAKAQREDRLRLRRQKLAQAASGLAQGAKEPPRAIPVPTRPGKPSARPTVSPWRHEDK
jgi:hypothetical protein